MIHEVDSLHTIDAIVEFAGRINRLNKKALKKMMLESLFLEHRFLVVDTDGENLQGAMFATVENFDGENVAFIQVCYSNKQGNVQSMLDKLIDWARSLGLKKMIFMSERSPKAWARKYKFEQSYTVMTRGI